MLRALVIFFLPGSLLHFQSQCLRICHVVVDAVCDHAAFPQFMKQCEMRLLNRHCRIKPDFILGNEIVLVSVTGEDEVAIQMLPDLRTVDDPDFARRLPSVGKTGTLP